MNETVKEGMSSTVKHLGAVPSGVRECRVLLERWDREDAGTRAFRHVTLQKGSKVGAVGVKTECDSEDDDTEYMSLWPGDTCPPHRVEAEREDSVLKMDCDMVIKEELVIGPTILQKSSTPHQAELPQAEVRAPRAVCGARAASSADGTLPLSPELTGSSPNDGATETVPPETSTSVRALEAPSRMCGVKSLTNHERRKRGRKITMGRRLKCNHCEYATQSRSRLIEHLNMHTDSESYHCNKCKYSTSYRNCFADHIRTHMNKKLFHSVSRRSSIDNHMLTHNSQTLYKCEQCNYSSFKKSNLKSHMLTHTGKKPYKCEQCNYSASRKHYLKDHMLTHAGKKSFLCEQCNYSSCRKGSIKRHMLTHTGEKPYKCVQCNYSASQKTHLKRHMLTHSGEKPYMCEQCNYSVSQKTHLKLHMLTHTGERPFMCEQCNYSASQKTDLKRHILTHTGERPFMCEQCNYSASRKFHLKQHMLTHTCYKSILKKHVHNH